MPLLVALELAVVVDDVSATASGPPMTAPTATRKQ